LGAVIAPTGFSLPFAINAAGEVVGYCYDEHTPANVITEAFVYQDGRALRFTVPESNQTGATSLNNLGQVVGNFTIPDDPDNRRAFLRQPNGRLTVLGTFGALQAIPMAINDRGQIAGWTNTVDGGIHAFLLQPGSRTPQDLGSLGPDTFAQALGINNLGQVVGNSGLISSGPNPPFPSHAFLYSEGRMRDLGTLGGITSAALGINNLGQIVGWSSLASSESVQHGFVLIAGQMRDLNKLLNPTVTGWVILIATDINDRGEIVAFASRISNPDIVATVILKPTL
jgi:chitinase